MAKNPIHFFTEQNNLNLQSNTAANFQPFGCVTDSLDTLFNVTSKHTATLDSFAYAVTDGQIFVQEDNTNASLLNIALKPKNQHLISGYTIRFFIYRGIKKSSLVNGNNIATKPSSSSDQIDLLTKIWKAQDSINTINNTTDVPSKNVIGLCYTPNSGAPFVNQADEYLESFFYKTVDAFHTWDVKLGESIGKFDKDHIGFEILVGNFQPTIGDLREQETAFTGEADYDNLSTEQKFIDHCNREKILNYLDPCAFYGIFYSTGVKSNNGKLKGEDLVLMLNQKFSNANKIYVDIRNRHNQSLAFYHPSFLNVNVYLDGTHMNSNLNEYHTSYWPIIIIDTSTITPISDTNVDFTVEFIESGLAVTGAKRVIHLAQGFYKDEFPKVKKKLTEISVLSNSTSVLNLNVATCSLSSQNVVIPTIIKAGYIIKVADSLPPDSFELESQTYIDNLFKLNDIYDDSGNMIFPFNPTKPCCWRMLEEEVYVDEDSGYVGGYMAKVGYAKDSSGFYFFGFSSGDELRKSSVDPFIINGESDESHFFENVIQNKLILFSINVEKLSINSPAIPANAFADSLPLTVLNPVTKFSTSPESFFYLRLAASDFINISNTLVTISNFLPTRLSLDVSSIPLLDNNSISYILTKLYINGYTTNSTISKTLFDTQIKFYLYEV